MHELLVNRLFKPAQEKVWLGETDRPAMTIAVDLGRKATKPTNQPFYNFGACPWLTDSLIVFNTILVECLINTSVAAARIRCVKLHGLLSMELRPKIEQNNACSH